MMFAPLVLFLSLLLPSLGSLTPLSTTSSTMLSFGNAHIAQTYVLKTPSDRITSISVDAPTGSRGVLSNFSTGYTQIERGVYNITLEMTFESWVGKFDYAVMVDSISAQGESKRFSYVDTHAVYGLVVYHDNTILSGDEAAGVQFEHFLTPSDEGRNVEILTYAPEGVDMTPEIQGSEMGSGSGRGRLLAGEGVVLRDGGLHIRPRDFSSGYAMVDIVCRGLEMDGEVFETVLPVSVSETPRAPAVLVGVNVSSVNGVTKIEGVVWNGGRDVSIVIGGEKIKGAMIEEERYEFEGKIGQGLFKDLRLLSDGDDGVVGEGVVVESLGGEEEDKFEGKDVSVGIVMICVIVGGVAVIMVCLAFMIHRRSVKLQSVFVDGRPVHIARDVYGRGSLHV